MAQYDGLIEVQSLGSGEGTLFIFSMKMEIAPDPELLEMSFGGQRLPTSRSNEVPRIEQDQEAPDARPPSPLTIIAQNLV